MAASSGESRPRGRPRRGSSVRRGQPRLVPVYRLSHPLLHLPSGFLLHLPPGPLQHLLLGYELRWHPLAPATSVVSPFTGGLVVPPTSFDGLMTEDVLNGEQFDGEDIYTVICSVHTTCCIVVSSVVRSIYDIESHGVVF